MSLWSRIRNAVRPSAVDREIDDELRAHIQEAIETGREPSEAKRALGSTLRVRDESHDVRVVPWLDSVRADVIFGWRQLKKRKMASATAVLSLALAIGACTAAFRLIDALFLRPLPVANPERLYVVAFEGAAVENYPNEYDSCSYPMFRLMRAAVKDRAESVAISYAERTDLTYGSDQEMEKAYWQYVSGWMFDSFGLRPAAGRLLTEDDDSTPGAHPYAVLSYDYWTRRFARDPKVVGRSFRAGTNLFEIIGVAPEQFTGTESGIMTDIFVPMTMKTASTLASANNFWLRTFVHLKAGVAPEPVGEKLRAVFEAGERERVKSFPALPKKRIAHDFNEKLLFKAAGAGRSNLQRDYWRSLTVLAVLVALVLLIACANVANLLIAQTAARAREMALRVSIGAGRGRLVQMVLVESALLAFLAAGLGGVFAWWAAPLIVGRINPVDHPARLVLSGDWRVLTFGLALAFAVTILLGVTPAWRASGVQPAGALKGGEDPHSRRRIMHALIAAQTAFCFVIYFVAAMFVRTLDHVAHQPLGFSADRILNLETVTYRPQPPVFWDEVAEHLRRTSGVEKVAAIGWPLLSGESRIDNVSIDGGPPSDVFSDTVLISPGWLETMKIPLLDGRDFRASEFAPNVAIVNEAFAKQFFDGGNPAGKSFDRVDGKGARTHVQIVGLVRNARSRDNLRRIIRPTEYIPIQSLRTDGGMQPLGRGTFVVHTSSSNPLALASILRREVTRARPEFRVSNIRTQQEIDDAQLVRERLLAMLAVFFATMGVLLAGIGLFGVLDYTVLQRRREIGIRMALGARARDVARSVTGEVFGLVVFGGIVGLAAGLFSVRYIASLLYEVRPSDAGTLAFPSVLVSGVALVAALPAVIRAARIDPAVTLRTE